MIYAAGPSGPKCSAAIELLRLQHTISAQVVNEFAQAARRKLQMNWDTVDEWVGGLETKFNIVPLTFETSCKALEIAQLHQLHIYDANIWAAAILAGCEALYSEDMHAGLTIQGTTLRNPFLG